MDFVQALREGNDSTIDFFKTRIELPENSLHDTVQRLFSSMEQRFNSLMSDGDDDKPLFLVPELPKLKKEVKGKRRSNGRSTTSKISTKPNQGAQHGCGISSANSTFDSIDSAESVRKSSRLASKANQVLKQEVSSSSQSHSSCKTGFNETYVKPVQSEVEIPQINPISKTIHKSSKVDRTSKSSTSTTNLTNMTGYATASEGSSEPPSPSLPPAKIRCIESVNFEKPSISRQILDVSAFSVGIKDEQPLGSSTPTNPLPEIFHTAHQHTPSQASTAKKMKIQKTVVHVEPIVSKMGNQEKILQEKNINVKLIEEKCEEARKKKEDKIKSSAEEVKRKREERARKVAAKIEAATQEKMKQIQKIEEKEMKLKQIEKEKNEKQRLETLKKKELAANKQAENEKRRKEEEKAKLRKVKKPVTGSEYVEYVLENVSEASASSEDEERPKNKIPSWATKENRTRPLRIQAFIDEKQMIRPWFFDRSLKYPKLEELFAGANLENRPRASSALWNTIVEFNEAFPLHD